MARLGELLVRENMISVQQLQQAQEEQKRSGARLGTSLVKLGMVTQQQLRDARRYVIVGAFVVAAVLTPPDVLSQFMLAVPLILLYELGIVLASLVKTRSRNPESDDRPGRQVIDRSS